jgi:DNA invertase Pin-like site-specific DNA recombinase
MANVKPGLRTFLYARVSKDQLKRGRSVSQQVADGRRAADDFEVASLRVYDRDNDKSASVFGKKFRDDWHRMMTDLAAGEADLVIFWEISRGSRTTGEGLAFVDTCAEQSVLVHIITEDSTYNPRTSGDRKRLLDMFTAAEFESGRTSERVLRDKANLRGAGRPDGKIPFGHRRLYDERTRELIRQEPHPVNRDCIREGIRRVRKGESTRRIMADFNKRNQHDRDCPRWVPTITEGVPWTHSGFNRTIMNPAHIGMRRDPEWKPGSGRDEFIPAAWPPLFDDPAWITEWWAAYRILNDPQRATSKSAQVKYLVSRFMTCNECGRRTAGTRPAGGKRNPRYICRDDDKIHPAPEQGPGCTSIVAQKVDDFISELVIKRLAQPDVIAAASDTDDADAVIARSRAAALRSKLDEFWNSAMRTDGRGITLAQYEQARNEIEPQIEAALATAQAAAAPPLLREFLSLTQGAGEEVVRRVWVDDLPIEAHREIVKLLFESIKLKPGRVGRVPFDPERIDYKWREW